MGIRYTDAFDLHAKWPCGEKDLITDVPPRAVALVGQRADKAADPVEIVGLGIERHIAQIVRHLRDICVHRQPRGKCRGAEAHPLDTLNGIGDVASNLTDRRHARAVDADRIHARKR